MAASRTSSSLSGDPKAARTNSSSIMRVSCSMCPAAFPIFARSSSTLRR